MRCSALGQFVLWLHKEAGAPPNEITEELSASAPPEHPVARELYTGRIRSREARKIRKYALRALADLGLALRYIDAAGYTTVAVRALLTRHYDELWRSPLGSDAHCVYLDLCLAHKRLPPRLRAVVAATVAGYGPQEIGVAFGANGSRLVNRAIRAVVRVLEDGGERQSD